LFVRERSKRIGKGSSERVFRECVRWKNVALNGSQVAHEKVCKKGSRIKHKKKEKRPFGVKGGREKNRKSGTEYFQRKAQSERRENYKSVCWVKKSALEDPRLARKKKKNTQQQSLSRLARRQSR